MKGTKLSFMRDILADKKLHLKQNEVIRLDIPAYKKLSVKNLYEDAMKDSVLTRYLPTKEQLSNKLPECQFFFGIIPKTPLSTNDLNIQFKGAPCPGSLAGCLGTLVRDPEVALPSASACTDEMFICCL